MATSNFDKDFEQLKKDLTSLRNDLSKLGDDVGHLSREKASQVGEQVSARAKEGADYSKQIAEQAQAGIQTHPLTSLLSAFGIGLALGHMLDRRS